MNLIAVAPLWLIIVLALAIVAAAAEDAARLRISNITCAVVAISAIVAMLMSGGSIFLWQNFVLLAAILAVGTLAFSAGWLGGGDVKLLAALGLWVDLRSGLSLLIGILLAGGLVALAYVGARIVRMEGFKTARHRRIPYGLAIAVGTLIRIWFVREPQTHLPPGMAWPSSERATASSKGNSSAPATAPTQPRD